MTTNPPLPFAHTPLHATVAWLAQRLLDARAAPLTVQQTLGCQQAGGCLRNTTPLLNDSRRAYWQSTDAWLADHPQGGPGDAGGEDAQARPTTTRQEARHEAPDTRAATPVLVDFTVVGANSPARIGKRFELRDGKLKLIPGGNLQDGTAERLRKSLRQIGLSVTQSDAGLALILGVPRTSAEKHHIVTQREATTKARQIEPERIARTQEDFMWPEGPGLLLIDTDAPKTPRGGPPLPRSAVRERLLALLPEAKDAPALMYDSSSGWVYNSATDEQLRGQRGIHTMLVIADASHAPEAAKVLHLRALVAGYGYIEVDNAGRAHAKTFVDAVAASGAERLVFSYGAECGAGLDQRRPAGLLFNEAGKPLETRKLLKLTAKLQADADEIVAALKADPDVMAEQEVKRAAWEAGQAKKMIAKVAKRRARAGKKPMTNAEEQDALEHIKAQLARVSASHAGKAGAAATAVLEADCILVFEDGTESSVDEILADPQRFDGLRCADPMEPDYGDDPRIAQVYTSSAASGGPIIYSHAHGGVVYRLQPSAASVFELLERHEGEAGSEAQASGNQAEKALAQRETTDLANAKRLASAYGNEVVHASGIGWLAWDGRRWSPDKELAERRAHGLSRLIDREIADLSQRELVSVDEIEVREARKRLRALSKHAERSEGRSAIEAALALFKREVATSAPFDAQPDLMNVANGTLDLRSGQLRKFDPNDRLTMLAGVAFDAAASAPRWLKFMEEITCGSAPLAQFLQVFVGYTLTGHVREQVMLFALGHGANGKSVMFNVIAQMMGDYAVTLPPGAIDATSNADDERMAARLRGRRLALIEEPREGLPLREGAVKWFTGADRMTGRLLYQEAMPFWPQHKLILRANHRPTIAGTDDGIWRRILLAQFAAHFEGAGRDLGLQDYLTSNELPGILNWALQGARQWYSDGLQVPIEVRALTDAYRSEEDRLAQFFDEHVKAEPGVATPRQVVFDAYRRWCDEQNCRPFGSQRFGRGLERWGNARGVSVRRNAATNTTEIVGLRVVHLPGTRGIFGTVN